MKRPVKRAAREWTDATKSENDNKLLKEVIILEAT